MTKSLFLEIIVGNHRLLQGEVVERDFFSCGALGKTSIISSTKDSLTSSLASSYMLSTGESDDCDLSYVDDLSHLTEPDYGEQRGSQSMKSYNDETETNCTSQTQQITEFENTDMSVATNDDTGTNYTSQTYHITEFENTTMSNLPNISDERSNGDYVRDPFTDLNAALISPSTMEPTVEHSYASGHDPSLISISSASNL